jgi:hypothetical protein
MRIRMLSASVFAPSAFAALDFRGAVFGDFVRPFLAAPFVAVRALVDARAMALS